MYRRNSHHLFGAIVFFIALLIFAAVETIVAISFSINVTNRLKRAADANTVEIAIEELDSVVSFLEENDIKNGYTSVLYQTPDEDIGFWYKNLKTSLTELKGLPADSSTLEKSNALMKLRETLLDSGKDSDTVTEPDGISRYPHNTAWACGNWILIPILVLFVAYFGFRWFDD